MIRKKTERFIVNCMQTVNCVINHSIELYDFTIDLGAICYKTLFSIIR